MTKHEYLLVLDLEDILIDSEKPFPILDILADKFNKKEEIESIREKYCINSWNYININKEERFEEMYKKIIMLYKDISIKEMEDIVEKINIDNDVYSFFNNIKKNVLKANISYGINTVLNRLVSIFDFCFNVPNIAHQNEGFINGEVRIFVNMQDKEKYVRMLQRLENIPKEKTVFIGKNLTDVGCYQCVKYKIAKNSPCVEELKRKIPDVVIIDNLNELKEYLQKEINIFIEPLR